MDGERPHRLGVNTLAALQRADNDVIASAASVWETSIKTALGKLRAPDSLWDEIERGGVRLISIDRADAEAAGRLPLHHRDPFDRMLIAQARERGAVLVTADRWAGAYDVRVLPADM